MEELIKRLRSDYPSLTFVVGSHLCWSPGKKEIYYDPTTGSEGTFGMLHEIGHARLGHKNYATDVDLLRKEVSAWEEALRLAKQYGIALKKTHIQDCLDSYREWVFRRSICPTCGSSGVQAAEAHYQCLNCSNKWQVSTSRFCRPYRSSNNKSR